MAPIHPLLAILGLNLQEEYDYYYKDTFFPMIIIRYNEEFVLNMEKMNTWIDKNTLREELDSWLQNGIPHPANPIVQLRAFLRERPNKIVIPSSTFFDLVPIKSEEYNFLIDNDLMLDEYISKSGGRSRKKRQQYRIKKSHYRSRTIKEPTKEGGRPVLDMDTLLVYKQKNITIADIHQMKAYPSALELKNAGYTLTELRTAKFSFKELRDAGFTLEKIWESPGFSSQDLIKSAGFTLQEVINAGFTPIQIDRMGYILTREELHKAGFNEIKDFVPITTRKKWLMDEWTELYKTLS